MGFSQVERNRDHSFITRLVLEQPPSSVSLEADTLNTLRTALLLLHSRSEMCCSPFLNACCTLVQPSCNRWLLLSSFSQQPRSLAHAVCTPCLLKACWLPSASMLFDLLNPSSTGEMLVTQVIFIALPKHGICNLFWPVFSKLETLPRKSVQVLRSVLGEELWRAPPTSHKPTL